MMRKIVGVIVAAAVFGSFVFFAVRRPSPDDTDDTILSIGRRKIHVETADTPDARYRGLSNRNSLASDRGMLFVFDEPGMYGFVMRDMNFPLDIIWIDRSGRIVGIQESATPESYPEVFMPPSPVRYVLEVNAGWASSAAVVAGDTVEGVPD